jgi:hypothetical protein
MIGQGLGRLAFAERLSIPQLEEALANRTIPAYIGVPLLEEKVQMKERMMAAQAGMAQPPQMTIEEEVIARANQAEQGIDQLPVEMPEYESPEYATGGIVALAGGDVIRAYNGLPEEMYEDASPRRGIFPSIGDYFQGVGDYFQGGFYNDLEQLKRLGYTDAQISQMTVPQRAEVSRVTRSYVPERTPVSPDQGIAPDVEPDNRALLNQADAAMRSAPAEPPDTGIAPPETPAAPIGAPQASVPGLIGRAEQLYGALYGDQKPETPKQKSEYLNQAQEFFTQAGVDLNLASKQAEEIARQKADLEGDRREAKKFGVISAGLAILAGDPASSAIENIGKGLGKGMEKYTTAINDIKKTEREMQALERSLAVAQNQSRMGLATVAAGDYQAAQKRYDDLNKDMRTSKADLLKALMSDDRARQVVEAQMKAKPSQYSEIREDLIAGGMTRGEAAQSFLGATKTGALTPANIQTSWDRMGQVDKLKLRKLNPPITTVQEYQEYRLRGGTIGAAPGSAADGAQQGKVIDFSSIR